MLCSAVACYCANGLLPGVQLHSECSRGFRAAAQKGSMNIICSYITYCVQRNNLSTDGALFKPHDVTQSNFRWDLPAGQVQYFYE